MNIDRMAQLVLRDTRKPMQVEPDIAAELRKELDEAERKAWDALGRYKFQMFGYWAAIWIHLNRIGGFKRANPWKRLVLEARR